MQEKKTKIYYSLFVLGTFFFVIFFFRPQQEANAFEKPFFIQCDPLEKIYIEQNDYKEVIDTPEVVRGGHGNFQLLLHSGKYNIQGVKIHVSPFHDKNNNTIDSITCGFEAYVGVSKLAPERSSFTYVSKKHLYPDPILEVSKINVDPRSPQPIWISIYIPNNVPAGIYSSEINVSGISNKKKVSFRKRLSLHVYDINLPEQRLSIANWFSNDNFLKSFNGNWQYAQHNSKEWIDLLKETAKKLKESHNTSVLISPLQWTKFNIKNGKYSYDFTTFDKLVRLFIDCGVLKTLEGGFIAQRENGWESNFLVNVPVSSTDDGNTLKQLPVSSKEVQRFYQSFMPALYKHIKTTFPNIQYLQHIADEPIDKNAKSYIEIAKYLKKICPDLRIIETTHTVNVGNYIDVIVPELDYLTKDYDEYKKFQQKGKSLWFYTSYLPQREFANRFIEQPLLMPRILHWINFKYNISGYLHWGFNRWVGNPYKETIQDQGGGIILPGGDSWIIYPSENGVIYGSIRLEAMRDGVEDYSLLKMLEQKNPTLAHELCNRIIINWDKYDINPKTFNQIRHKILEALVQQNRNN